MSDIYVTAQETEGSSWPFPRPDMTREFVKKALDLIKNKKESISNNYKRETDKLIQIQKRLREFTKLTQLIRNSLKKPEDTLHVEPGSELHQLLIKASQTAPASTMAGESDDFLELDSIPLDPNKTDYTKDEVDTLLGNIKLSTDDLNTVQQLQMQKVTNVFQELQDLYRAMMRFIEEEKNAKDHMITRIDKK